MDYTPIRHSEVAQSYKKGANWFYWIAGLSIVTSLIAFFGGGIAFIISLATTQVIDGIAAALAPELGGGAQIVALLLDLVVTGVFVLFGWLANKKYLWAYAVGMVAFLADGLVSLFAWDMIGIVMHGVVLFFLFRGFMAGRELLDLDKLQAQRSAAAAAQAQATL